MNKTALKEASNGALPRSYKALVARLMPRKIHSADQYEQTALLVDQLALLPRRTEDQEDYLDLLVHLISEYDAAHYPMVGESGTDLLNSLLEFHGMSARGLAELLAVSHSLAYKIKSGSRNLTLSQIQVLAGHFKVKPEALMRRCE